MPMLRVAIAGMSTESSTFAPHRTTRAEFRVSRGAAELADRYPYLAELTELGAQRDIEFLPLFHAGAMPGGQVLPEVYDEFEHEILDLVDQALADGPLHGFHLDLHGAMAVEGRYDAEGRLAEKVRARVGPECLISASLDLHGQVSERLAAAVDLLTAFRTAPHVDYLETRERAVRNLVRCLIDGIRPVRAWVRVPVLLPGEKTSTRVEPAAGVYASLVEAERSEGVIDAALLVGYAWADEPRSSATVLVSGTDTQAVRVQAERIARSWWEVRERFEFCAPAGLPDWAIDQALRSDLKPFFVSDSGDNPTAGGSNDSAAFLADLLATGDLASGAKTAIWASCIAPEAVQACETAGVGSRVTVSVGGLYGGSEPVRLEGEVTCLSVGSRSGGRVAVVRSGGISAILTERREAYHYVADLTALGLDPAEHDLTAVKIGYLQPDLYAHAADWVLALTPGGVDQHLTRLDYRNIERPMHPLDADISDPDLTPTIFRS